ncbi:DUF397 domain-containing protein [Micromonospora sp. WMMD882]|uniref:DUF397 domain-containing protein n=1 Tax=Micromonospora sp. WMMD882 TaxID=3015151 RepID=UPI00248D139A|nr:DUF397 domain-containing protein [Micromonospora sp. WMMD882]WBB79855.1 DUF397 domain-containing protein [Micromonospora sp. WMMD882]
MERNIWRTSTRSGNNGQCVEVRDRGTHVDVRDSKAPASGMLSFSPVAWAIFTETLQTNNPASDRPFAAL